jgi:hypothetical protein
VTLLDLAGDALLSAGLAILGRVLFAAARVLFVERSSSAPTLNPGTR